MIRGTLFLPIILAFLLIGFLNCSQAKKPSAPSIKTKESLAKARVFNDDFEKDLQDFWNTNEFVDSSRYGIVQDPLSPNNKVLRIVLKPKDRIAKGPRSEIKVKKSIDSFGYRNNVSFKFMLPESFYAKEEKKGGIAIQQWHNRPYPGFDWKTSPKVRPPEALYFKHNEKGEWTLFLQTGLSVGNIHELRLGKIDSVSPNTWHTFNLESFWSMYSDGYFKASLDNQCFVYEEGEQCKVNGRNVYHTSPSYFKMGLYSSGSQENDRVIYFDDFEMTAQRIHYFPRKPDE